MKIQDRQNPRFVWLIGSIIERFPDLPDNTCDTNDLVLWDRQEGCAVATIHNPYAQIMCLETCEKPENMPLTCLEEWLNSDEDGLESEGIEGTREEFKL